MVVISDIFYFQTLSCALCNCISDVAKVDNHQRDLLGFTSRFHSVIDHPSVYELGCAPNIIHNSLPIVFTIFETIELRMSGKMFVI